MIALVLLLVLVLRPLFVLNNYNSVSNIRISTSLYTSPVIISFDKQPYGLRKLVFDPKTITLKTDSHLSSKVRHCSDPQKLMPLCQRCIPGLQLNGENKCELSEETTKLRETLFSIAANRGMPGTCQVYKYLSTDTLRRRHKTVGKWLDSIEPKRILDIGAYTNPIHSFMEHCPESVFMMEPCGELAHDGEMPWSSKEVSCGGRVTVQNVLPKSIKSFLYETHMQQFDVIVCIGCDKTYGPNWQELMSMPRPFHLVLEFSTLTRETRYPMEDSDGCSIIATKDFDFSDCPDCGFDVEKNDPFTRYAKERKLYLWQCNEYPQDYTSRAAESKAVLAPLCNNAKASPYIGMACVAEELLTNRIMDTALMAIDAGKEKEEEDRKVITAQTYGFKKYKNKGNCNASMLSYHIARKWWSIDDNQEQFEKANSYLERAIANKEKATSDSDLIEAMCFAASARFLYSSAVQQERVIDHLYLSIRLYQSTFRSILAAEPPSYGINSYHYHIKTCPPFLDQKYINEVAELEPIFPLGRNFDSREFGQSISFNPYIPLMSFESVQSREYRKMILIDVGANGFAASPKQLIDNYAAFGKTFDEVIMFDPKIDGMQIIPDIYSDKMDIIFHQQYLEIGTRNPKTDVLSFIKEKVHKDDFVVLKYDVDEEGCTGPTMEWGFLGDLLYSDVLNLVDELYVELHFYDKEYMYWNHQTHSAQQRYDIVRQLRACGMAIHDWP